jgi:hypothetical protein
MSARLTPDERQFMVAEVSKRTARRSGRNLKAAALVEQPASRI